MPNNIPESYSPESLDKPQDECGIVVVVSPDYEAARIAATGVAKLENRGHEMTGIVTDKEGKPFISTGFGTGSDLFPDGGYDYNFSNPSTRAMAHARYSTQGTQDLAGAQPHAVMRYIEGRLYYVVHVENGNLMNTHSLAASQGLTEADYVSDNDLMAHTFMNNLESMLKETPGQPIDTKELARKTISLFEGAFTSAVMLAEDMVVYTDHHGHKPAVIGQLDDGGTIVASEATALEAVGATVVREMKPGEMVIINPDGRWEAEQWAVPEPQRCLLEVLYVMKPQTERGTLTSFGGVVIKEARRNAGRALAQVKAVQADGTIATIEADFGIGLPNSGVPVGEGLCEETGLPYNGRAVIANKDRRSFIEPTQAKRDLAVAGKLVADPRELDGKIVVGGDDTMIRGTVGKKNTALMREAGVREFHMRIGAPMILYTCERGIDLGQSQELLAARAAEKLNIDISGGYESLTEEQIEAMTAEMCDYTGVDSLAFLTPDLLRKAVLGEKATEFCMKCMTGEEPSVRPTLVEIKSRKPEALVASIV